MAQMDNEDNKRISIRWYTEQRGRVVGNTVAWEDLPLDTKVKLRLQVQALLEKFQEAYTLEVYGMTDQPTTCPKCGLRTEFDRIAPAVPYRERHTCLNCKYQFIVEECEDEEEVDE